MLKILYVIDGLHGGGKERQLVEILKALTGSSEITTGVITFNKNKHYSETVSELVPFFVELKKRPTRLEPLFSIWHHIDTFKPDIIHTWDSLSSFYSWLPCKFFNIKLIDGSIRDAGIEKGWQYYFKRFFLKMANSIIANSYAGLNAYQVNGNVIYNAINYDRFLKNTGVTEFNILMTANFTDYKDHKTFLNASAELVNARIVDNVYLLGEGKHRSAHQEWINKAHPEISSRFIFTGAVKNVEEFLSKCKVGILCSTVAYKEGVSNAVLEYMAAGLVAIATDVGGTSEIIEHAVNGFLVEPGNPTAIVEIVIQIKDQQIDTNNIISNAMNTIKTKFCFKSNINELLNIYKSIVN